MHRPLLARAPAQRSGALGALGLAAALLPTGCGAGSAYDPGLDAGLRVDGASFFRGALPEDGAGPDVLGVFLTQTTFPAGRQGKSFRGVLQSGSTAAAIALEGDRGYWLVPAGFPPPEAPDSPSFHAPLSFSGDVPPGEHALWVWAADASGRFGRGVAALFTLTAREPPAGELVVTLSWDTQSDLDLHIMTPDGVEVYHDNVNSWQRAGSAGAADEAWRSGGILDFDSNAEYSIDGRRNENIIWTAPPPPGRYAVRVDTPSLCGEASARWFVEVWRRGSVLAAARGLSLPAAVRFGHEKGAGVLALEFEVP